MLNFASGGNGSDKPDAFAVHRLNRDRAAFTSTRNRHKKSSAGDPHTPMRQARHFSMRDGFSA